MVVYSEGLSSSTAPEAARSTRRPRVTRVPAFTQFGDVLRALFAMARELGLGHQNRVFVHYD
jgi:hypothetical protein